MSRQDDEIEELKGELGELLDVLHDWTKAMQGVIFYGRLAMGGTIIVLGIVLYSAFEKVPS